MTTTIELIKGLKNHALLAKKYGCTFDAKELNQAALKLEKLRITAINLIAACEEREGDDGERCYLVPAQEFDDLQEFLNE